MAAKKEKNQIKILDELCYLGYGQAESEDESKFNLNLYPISQHLRAFEPDVVIVQGDRGTGKSELFKAVFNNKLLPKLSSFAPKLRLPENPQSIQWKAGYPIGAGFPDRKGLRKTIKKGEITNDFWFAYLVRILKNELKDDSLNPLFQLPGGDPENVLEIFNTLGQKPLLALDALDQKLEKENSYIFIGYDELDTLGGYDWETMKKAISGLIAFWAGYSRRWRRIRAKIFLRSDLFRQHSGMGGADFAKLAANRVELTWSNKNLFAMLIKRIANKGDELLNLCKNAKIEFDHDETFGHIPSIINENDARQLIERLIGKYMGANSRKGQSFNWVLDHLRDGKKMVTPRLLVRLFEVAASKERDNPQNPSLIIHPISLRRALGDISQEHVNQAITSEWPWLYGLKTRFTRNDKNKLVPWEKKELRKILEYDWDNDWVEGKPDLRPPASESTELIDYLIQLGIFRGRSDDRVDVPDIYLYGLGLKRKGGVKSRVPQKSK